MDLVLADVPSRSPGAFYLLPRLLFVLLIMRVTYIWWSLQSKHYEIVSRIRHTYFSELSLDTLTLRTYAITIVVGYVIMAAHASQASKLPYIEQIITVISYPSPFTTIYLVISGASGMRWRTRDGCIFPSLKTQMMSVDGTLAP